MISFPNNPNINDIFTFNSKSWKWNGYAWDIITQPINIYTNNIIENQDLENLNSISGDTQALINKKINDKFDTTTFKSETFQENNIKIFDVDGNDKDSNINISNLSTNQTIPFNQLLPFTHLLTIMNTHDVSNLIEFSGSTTNIINGSRVIVTLKANGRHIPIFSSQFKQTADSLQYNNITNEYNTIEFLYDGLNFWYKIYNTGVSNIAYKNEVLLTTNETAFTPTGDYNPTTKKYVDEQIMYKIANYYPGIPSPDGEDLGYYGIKWNSNFPNSGCLRTGTLSGYQGGGYYGEFGYPISTRPNSNIPNNLLFVHNKIRRCVANVDGTVKYWLDPNNSYNKENIQPSIFGTVTTNGRLSLISTGSFTLAASEYVGKYVHLTTSGKADRYCLISAKVNDNQLTIIDPRRGTPTSDIFEVGDTFEICTAILDGSDGDVMVYVPKFYIRYSRVSGVNTLDISLYPYSGFNVHPAFVENLIEKDYILVGAFEAFVSSNIMFSRAGVVPTSLRTRAAFRNDATNKGSGWVQELFWYRSALQTLFFVEYADLNSDHRLQGYIFRNGFRTTDIRFTGRTLNGGDGNISIIAHEWYDADIINDAFWFDNKVVGMAYRGVENFWGSLWQWTDGVNVNDGRVYLTNNKSVLVDDTTTGYDDTMLNWLSASSYIREVHPISGAFIPSLGGGSASTYFCDQSSINNTGWRVVNSGGTTNNGLTAGVVQWNVNNDSSNVNANIGSQLCFKRLIKYNLTSW